MVKMNIWDIDGPLVESFSPTGLNPGAYNEKLKTQRTSKFALDIVKWRKTMVDCFVTGRKELALKEATIQQLFTIFGKEMGYITFYPEEMNHDPFENYLNWKVGMIIEKINKGLEIEVFHAKFDGINIIEDDMNVISRVIKQLLQMKINTPVTLYYISCKSQEYYIIEKSSWSKSKVISVPSN